MGSNPIFHPETLLQAIVARFFLSLIVSYVLRGDAMAVKRLIAQFEDIAKIVQHAH